MLALSSHAVGGLDSSDPTVLYNLWSAFARCSDFIENGRRLENLSWRLWNRDVLNSSRSDRSSSSLASTALPPSHDHHHHHSTSQQEASGSQLCISAERPKIRGRSSTDDTVAKLNQLSLNSRDSHRSNFRSGSSSRQSRKASHLRRNSSSFIRKKRPGLQQNPSGHREVHSTAESISTAPVKPVASSISTSHESQQVDPPRDSQPPHKKNLSTQQIQNIISLFKPEAEEEAYWRKLWLDKKQQKQEAQSHDVDASKLSRAFSKQKKVTSSKNVQPKSSISATNTSRPSLFARRSTTAVLDFANSSDEGDDSDDDSRNEVKETPPRRNNTFTSIVRGFSPSHISVSVVNRSPAIMSSEIKKSPSPLPESNGHESSQKISFPATKARPDKVTREHMFFIESSPSDGEIYGGESLSSNEELPIDKPMDLLKKKHPNNSNISKIDLSAQNEKPRRSVGSPNPSEVPSKRQPVSLFNKSKSTSAISAKIKDKYHEKKNGSIFIEPSSEDEWDSVDESDYSFDENSLAARIEESSKKQPLKRSSLLSSLFLNNPEMVQKEQASHLQKLERQEKAGNNVDKEKSNSPESIGLYRQLSNHAEAHHGSLPAEILNDRAQKVSDSSAVALSPRTTRRNMLASELSESVRRDLLWERQRASAVTWIAQNNQTNNTNDQTKGAQLRRSHTSIGVPYMKQSATTTGPISESWQEQFEEDDADFNYHARGW